MSPISIVRWSKLKTGNSRAPSLAPDIVDLTKQAWLLASLEQGASRIRSGHLLWALLADETLARRAREASGQLLEGQPGSAEARLRDGHRQQRGGGGGTGRRSRARPDAAGDGAPMAPRGSGALDQFTTDLTAQARAGKIDPILGRDTEIRQIIDILTRRRQNNPILTGEAGVGKTAVVEGFALRLASGDVPPALQGVTLRTLDLGSAAGGRRREGRVREPLTRRHRRGEGVAASRSSCSSTRRTQMIGAGGSAGQGDAANLLKPALARGELRTIAATTWAEYKKYFEKDAALTRRFQVVKVDEPTEPMAVAMLRGLVDTLEKHHNVRILDEAVSEAVRLSARYIPSRQLPDKAVSLIDTACARVGMSQAAMPPPVEDRQRRIALIDTEVGDPRPRDRRRRAASGASRGPAGGARDARAGTHRTRGALGAGEGAGDGDRRDARRRSRIRPTPTTRTCFAPG